MILYADTITPRLRYIADFIGKEIAGKPFQLTSDKNFFQEFNGPKLNYSKEKIQEGEFFLEPHGLLFEDSIYRQEIVCSEVNDIKIFFQTKGDLPFDIFAASFYLLSRYEEYLPHKKDMYGRYAHENSLAFQNSFLHLPLVNLWLQWFRNILKEKFPSFDFHSPSFTFLPTYDIDIAYSYRHKGLLKNTAGFLQSLLKFDPGAFKERWKVLFGNEKDPYDAYRWMDDLHMEFHLQPVYFFHVGAKQGKYDKNLDPRNAAIRELIQHHAALYPTGIHPSWRSGDEPELLKEELQTLKDITGKGVTASRQHYIRFTLPETFRRLIETGIQSDYSMGYGSINGFRASVASPFSWFDLEKNEATGLQIFPFCFMDANSFYEQKISPQQALEELMHYYQLIKSVEGLMITIWHNNFLGTEKTFKGWRETYASFIRGIRNE